MSAPPTIDHRARFWFVTFTTYGTWLPGDERGSVSDLPDGRGGVVRHNHVGEPYDGGDPGRRADADAARKEPVVRLSAAQAAAVLAQLRETAAHRGWVLHAASVAANHVHALVEVFDDPAPGRVRNDLKAYASRPLNRSAGRRRTWWTDRGSVRKKPTAGAVFAAVAYVRDQPDAHVRWLDPDSEWVRWLPRHEAVNGRFRWRRDLTD